MILSNTAYSNRINFLKLIWELIIQDIMERHVWKYTFLKADRVSCSRTHHSEAGESRISNPLIPSLMIYQLSHCTAPLLLSSADHLCK